MTDLSERALSDLGERAIHECQHLLISQGISLGRGTCLQGELISVSVLILPDRKDSAYRSVQVICHPVGQLRVDWERVGIWLRDADTREEIGKGVLDARGRSTLFKVRYSDSRRLEFLDPGDPRLVRVGSMAWEDLFSHSGPEKPFALRGISVDGRLEATANLQANGSLHIEVRAKHDSLRGGTIRFEIQSKQTQRILYSSTFTLRFDNGWMGDWLVRDELRALPEKEEFELFVRPAFEGER